MNVSPSFPCHQPFDVIIFNEVFHYFLSPTAALERALSLIGSGQGEKQNQKHRIVISHPKGSRSVEKQHAANSIFCPNHMPSLLELQDMIDKAHLPLQVVKPRTTNSLSGEVGDGGYNLSMKDFYFVVLETK